jgi:hypothetical protein
MGAALNSFQSTELRIGVEQISEAEGVSPATYFPLARRLPPQRLLNSWLQ